MTPAKNAEPSVEVGTHFFRQEYLYAFATRAEVTHHVRTQAVLDEGTRLPEILASWAALQPRVQGLIDAEKGVADGISVTEVPREHEDQLQAYAGDQLFQRTFSNLSIAFAIVEVDKLVAPQRSVNMDYVERLQATLPKDPQLSDLLEICVSPKRQMDPIQHLEIGANVHVFSSPNSDIRFLGSFVKTLTEEDLAAAVMGGLPAAAVISFIGYGGAPINVIRAGPRVVLNNGFHRAYALRAAGVTRIPVVVQISANPALDFPQQVAGLPREYLLRAKRPVLMKDFFEPGFALSLRVRERVKMVTVGINLNQHEVPS